MSAVTQDMAECRPSLEAGLEALGLALSPQQVDDLLRYQGLLAKWNHVYNLTAVRSPQDMVTHHLLDSLAVVPALQRHAVGRPLRVLDVGSGGGLPGVVLAVACPALKVDCVDTVAKKASFVQQVAASLSLPRLRGLHARVERLGTSGQGGGYDVVTSRAFASLLDFTSWSRAALKPGGVWMAMKGRHPTEELAALPADVEVFHVEPLKVPGLDAERCVVWMRLRSA